MAKTKQGMTLTFAMTCPAGQVRFNYHLPSRASEIQLSLALLHLSPALEKLFYNFSFKTKYSIVLACESIFSRTSLDARPQNVHMSSKVDPKYIQRIYSVRQTRFSFHLPFSYNLHILLAQGNGASTNIETC